MKRFLFALLALAVSASAQIGQNSWNGALGSDLFLTRGAAGKLYVGQTRGASNAAIKVLQIESGNDTYIQITNGYLQNGTNSFLAGSQAAPTAQLEAQGTGEHIRARYDVSNFATFTTGSTGILTINSTGTVPGVAISDPLAITGTVTHSGPEIATSVSNGAVTNSSTINTAGITTTRTTAAGAVTGVILQAGTVDGQMVTVVHESAAASTITMAAAATSNVADGVGTVIAGLTANQFIWNSNTSRWYHLK